MRSVNSNRETPAERKLEMKEKDFETNYDFKLLGQMVA